MVSKRILPLILAILVTSGAASAFATANPNVTTNPAPSASNSSSSDGVVRDAVCDPSIFARIKQKGWAEAQRENYINQSLIKRPVNTFAATCFDKQLGLATSTLGVPERENPANDSSPVNTKPYIDSINKTSGATVRGLLGPVDANGKPIIPTNGGKASSYSGFNPDVTAAGTNGDFECDSMDQIWEAATCGNMSGNEMPSLGEVAGGSDARTTGVAACSTKKDDTGLYTYDQTFKGIYSPGAGAENFDTPDAKILCETLPYSQLEANKCPKTCSSIRSADGKSIQCRNPGCKPNNAKTACEPL